jgi:hypothetical protein
MNAVMAPQDNPADSVRAKYKARSSYPMGEGYYWSEFLDHQKGKEGPFLLVVEGETPLNELTFHPRLFLFFGIFAPKSSDTLGMLCFGRRTKYFGNKEESSDQREIVIPDELHPSFLRTYHILKGEEPQFLATPMDHKIVEMITESAQVDTRLAKFISEFIPPKDVLVAKEAAHAMITLRDHLTQFFEHCIPPESFTNSLEIFWELQTRLAGRAAVLDQQNQEMRKQIEDQEAEIRLLR